jgi:hypothetical protein
MACCGAASLAASVNNWPVLKIKSHADGDEIQQGIHSLADAVADNYNDGAEPSAIMVIGKKTAMAGQGPYVPLIEGKIVAHRLNTLTVA